MTDLRPEARPDLVRSMLQCCYVIGSARANVLKGGATLRFPVEPRNIEREKAFIPRHDLPAGRRFAILTDIHTWPSGPAHHAPS